jgi:exodeoxyribonuclease V gamma subunit
VRSLGLKTPGADGKSLLDIFIQDILANNREVFMPVTIIVPNMSMANWLNDELATRLGIIANVKFKLLNQFIDEVYTNCTANTILKLSSIKYRIYDFIVTHNHDSNFLSQLQISSLSDSSNLHKIYQLAFELERIFIDYLRYRTKDILYGDFRHKLPQWQQEIFNQVLINQVNLAEQKTFLDVYQFFMAEDAKLDVSLPSSIYLFNVADISCANLDILNKLSLQLDIFCYQVVPSLEYYYDLLDSKTITRLSRKILKEPEVSVAELYLTDGNPLIANLGIKSRERNELLIANDVDLIDIARTEASPPTTLLQLMQSDIQNLQQRIELDKRVATKEEYYADPITSSNFAKDGSIAIHVCHNKLREVQVLFDCIGDLIINQPDISVADIAVYAPTIASYQDQIEAVFDNQYMLGANNALTKVPYHICGYQTTGSKALLTMLASLLTLDYKFRVTDIFALLNQAVVMTNLGLSSSEVELIHTWFHDNNIHFGVDVEDYQTCDYPALDLFSWRSLINKLILGVAILPPNDGISSNYVYDNVEFAHVDLLNRLLNFFDYLVALRQTFYLNELTLSQVTLLEVCNLLNDLHDNLLTLSDDKASIKQLISYLQQLELTTVVNLLVLVDIIKQYADSISEVYVPTGKLTFMSLGVLTNVQFKVVYIMGMNDGDIPRLQQKNRLNFLSKSVAFADINIALEDKQVLLDTILAAKEQLHISFIGRRDTDNKELPPSVSLDLFINVIKNSLVNPDEFYRYIYQEHALHPFNTATENYDLGFWRAISITPDYNNLHWNFKQGVVAAKADDTLISLSIKQLVNFYSYTNQGIYSSLEINQYKGVVELKDNEEFNLFAKQVLKTVFSQLEQLFIRLSLSLEDNVDMLDRLSIFEAQRLQLYTYLYQRGVLVAGDISLPQFEFIFKRYLEYKRLSGSRLAKISYVDQQSRVSVEDYIQLDDNYQVVLLGEFHYLANSSSATEPNYWLIIQGLIYLLLIKHARITMVNQDLPTAIIVDEVILRYGIADQATKGMRLIENANSDELLSQLLQFYVRGLTTPTVIDAKLIGDLAKKADLNQLSLNDYLNDDLINRLNQDRIFSNNFKDFFANHNLNENSLLFVANLLKHVELS